MRELGSWLLKGRCHAKRLGTAAHHAHDRGRDSAKCCRFGPSRRSRYPRLDSPHHRQRSRPIGHSARLTFDRIPYQRVGVWYSPVTPTRVSTKQFTHRDRQRLQRAAEHYLQTCYRLRTAARVSEFAALLGLTQPYISRIAPALTGFTLREFFRRRQLEYAATLLQRTPLPIRQIAVASGFGTASTFYRCFVAMYGMTPAAYRVQVTECDTGDRSRRSVIRRASDIPTRNRSERRR